MDTFIFSWLGTYSTPLLAMAFAAVFFFRKSIRKRHIVVLLITAVTSFVGFFAVLLWGIAQNEGQKSVAVLHIALSALAATSAGTSAAVGFAFILKHLGLASLSGVTRPPTAGRNR